MTSHKTKKQNGFNLIELAIVLAVIGIIVGGIYVGAASVYETTKRQKVDDELLNIVQNIRIAFTNHAVFEASFDENDAIQARLLPTDVVKTGGVFSPYGPIHINGDADGDTFKVEFDALSPGACNDVLEKTTASDEIISSFSVVGAAVNANELSLPVSVPDASHACADLVNNVAIEFRLRN